MNDPRRIYYGRPQPSSSGRQPDKDGKLPPVGNTADIKKPIGSTPLGAVELGRVWTAPDFDPNERAFCCDYARVIEISTPRWIVYDAFRFGVVIPEGAEIMWRRSRASFI